MIQTDHHYCQRNPRKLKAWAHEHTEVSRIGKKNRIQERKCKELGTAWKGQQDQQVGGRQKKQMGTVQCSYRVLPEVPEWSHTTVHAA